MIPRLATRGKLVLGTALLFLIVGALHGSPPLVALAGVVLAVLLALYLMFYPTAILLRRKKIELSWWVPPGDQPGGALAVDRPFQLHLAFRNHGSRRLRILSTHILAASGLRDRRSPERDGEPRPAGRGHDRGSPARGRLPRAARRGADVRRGARPVRHRGVLSEPDRGEDLPAHARDARQRGARARRRAPRAGRHAPRAASRAVGRAPRAPRALARRSVQVHRVEGDRAPPAADGSRSRERDRDDPHRAGRCRQRHARRARSAGRRSTGRATPSRRSAAPRSATAIASASCAFDTRPVVELPPDSGHHHYLQLVDRLLDTRSVVDADLTDVTAGELVALVARYLAHQEAIDVRDQGRAAARRRTLDADPGRSRRPALRRRRDRAAVQAAGRRDVRRRQGRAERVDRAGSEAAADRRRRRRSCGRCGCSAGCAASSCRIARAGSTVGAPRGFAATVERARRVDSARRRRADLRSPRLRRGRSAYAPRDSRACGARRPA